MIVIGHHFAGLIHDLAHSGNDTVSSYINVHTVLGKVDCFVLNLGLDSVLVCDIDQIDQLRVKRSHRPTLKESLNAGQLRRKCVRNPSLNIKSKGLLDPLRVIELKVILSGSLRFELLNILLVKCTLSPANPRIKNTSSKFIIKRRSRTHKRPENLLSDNLSKSTCNGVASDELVDILLPEIRISRNFTACIEYIINVCHYYHSPIV